MIYAIIECGSVVIETHFCEWTARERVLELCNLEGRDVRIGIFESFEALETFEVL